MGFLTSYLLHINRRNKVAPTVDNYGFHKRFYCIVSIAKTTVKNISYLLFGCPLVNFGPLSRGQLYSTNVNHCILSIFDLNVTRNIILEALIQAMTFPCSANVALDLYRTIIQHGILLPYLAWYSKLLLGYV